jgi:uncharacterized protein YoxC
MVKLILLSIDLFEVLKKKIDRTQKHFIHTLNELRKKIEVVEQQPNNFIEQSLIEQLKKQENILLIYIFNVK